MSEYIQGTWDGCVKIELDDLKEYEDQTLWFETSDMVYHAKLMIAGEEEIVIQTYTTIDKDELEGVYKKITNV